MECWRTHVCTCWVRVCQGIISQNECTPRAKRGAVRTSVRNQHKTSWMRRDDIDLIHFFAPEPSAANGFHSCTLNFFIFGTSRAMRRMLRIAPPPCGFSLPPSPCPRLLPRCLAMRRHFFSPPRMATRMPVTRSSPVCTPNSANWRKKSARGTRLRP